MKPVPAKAIAAFVAAVMLVVFANVALKIIKGSLNVGNVINLALLFVCLYMVVEGQKRHANFMMKLEHVREVTANVDAKFRELGALAKQLDAAVIAAERGDNHECVNRVKSVRAELRKFIG